MTEAQIRAQVEFIRKKDESANAVGIRCTQAWSGPDRLMIGERPHRVIFCRSDLQLRDALQGAVAAHEPLVALCPFDDGELGDDVRVRLAKGKLFHPMPMEALANLFKIKSKGIDRRIAACQPLMDYLIEQAPDEGYPVRPGGTLDLQTAWTEVIGRALGSPAAVVSLEGFLETSLSAQASRVLGGLTDALRRAFFTWATLSLGTPIKYMLPPVERGRMGDLLPIGLVLELMSLEAVAKTKAVELAQARMEPWFDGEFPGAGPMRAWGQTAGSVIRRQSARDTGTQMVREVLARFDQLLEEIKLSESAAGSDYSPHGLTLRFREFARVVKSSLDPGARNPGPRMAACLERIGRHILAVEHQAQQEKCLMAARLVCWLASGPPQEEPSGLAGLGAYYHAEGGFVDRARTVLESGTAELELRSAFSAVLKAVEARWQGMEIKFATSFAEWNQAGIPPLAELLPIEKVLNGVIGPMAAQTPLLLLVMDGMSLPVFREVLEDLVTRGGWQEASPTESPLPKALLAAVPSVTEISRRALFRGDLSCGTSPTEQSAFRTNELLYAQTGGQARPELFLKGDLQDAGELGLSTSLRKAVGNRKCRLVGVVLNVIDDQLKGSDQFSYEWNLDSIQPLRELLGAAQRSSRLIVLTSDHGHVLDRETKVGAVTVNGGDRYRLDGVEAGEGEIKISGPRILQATGCESVIVPWSRKLRYGPKRQGYHGGVNPQEMLVPFVVLRHASMGLPAGWKDVVPSLYRPAWWNPAASEAQEPDFRGATTKPETPETKGLDLFDHAAAQVGEEPSDWTDKLPESDIYKSQCARGVRGAPKAEELIKFIKLLEGRGGRMPSEMLAQGLGLPLFRLAGHVQNLARILNVDGYEVVNSDAGGGSVVLNIELLKQQFQLEG